VSAGDLAINQDKFTAAGPGIFEDIFSIAVRTGRISDMRFDNALRLLRFVSQRKILLTAHPLRVVQKFP
jgi:hypothetical protein